MKFEIYGGKTELTQWSKNEILVVNELPIGAEVEFYNDPFEDDPLKTEVYEMVDEVTGKTLHVCDIPNIFLTTSAKVKVRVAPKVKGLYGIIHSVIGAREKIFAVIGAEKPDDYVYEETDLETCPDCEGEVSEEELNVIINNYLTNNLTPVTDKEVIALLSDDK